MDEDETWNAIEEARSRINETIEDNDEALLAAIDIRKFKIFKTIDWNAIEMDILDEQNQIWSDSDDDDDEMDSNSQVVDYEEGDEQEDEEQEPLKKRFRDQLDLW